MWRRIPGSTATDCGKLATVAGSYPLSKLLSDAELRWQLGAAGRAQALAGQAPRVVAKATLKVYEPVCERNRRVSR
jgi:hypothetical protein